MCRPPTEPSRQEEFEHIVMNFIYDQEERIRQLENYMQDITDEFMEFSSKVALRLKERIKENESKPQKIKKITKYPDTKVLENSLMPSNPSQPRKNVFGFKPGKRANQSHHNLRNSLTIQPPTQSNPSFMDNDPIERDPSSHYSLMLTDSNRMFDPGGKTHDLFLKESHGPSNKLQRSRRSIHPGDIVDWEFMSHKGLAQSFFDSINTDTFSGPQWANLFQINEPIFCELTYKFIASFEFDATPCRYEPLHKGVTFRLGGVERENSLLELGWRIGSYSERESRDVAILSGLRNAETVNATYLTHSFWPSISDGGYDVRNTKAKSIRNPRIMLAHHCITMTITGRKETTHRVTEIDLFYLYCIFEEGIVCNIRYWLAKYLKSMGDKSVIYGGCL
ncbi:hypothetical protein Tco_0343700 [Tanacetum coccineum]